MMERLQSIVRSPAYRDMIQDPVVTTRDLPQMWKKAGLAALTMAAAVVVSFSGRRR